MISVKPVKYFSNVVFRVDETGVWSLADGKAFCLCFLFYLFSTAVAKESWIRDRRMPKSF